ncbi:tyrosine-type recombinase/integrase [Bacillus sp. S/N-304-OC-R1]|uniref:tyrosine-type recombinase/integrase n=1 Tax=Bacillus sp. S/N-304-OC-R1 TaxID=2758034 RepID=UPI001C8E381C|nr:tyrosine-type recombinase/integrase [Bacillus sp. S/N-304-OC-R1]MBY0122050.1 tyrosine-type recombinase/integrase [Bacillus sp. S/N-304-OC-R1]
MEYVEPIKDIEKIIAIKENLRRKSLRDFLLFVFGINTGIRVHDLLTLKVNDIWDGEGIKEFLEVSDDKGAIKVHYINSKVNAALQDYLSTLHVEKDDFLFKSKKNNLPITRQQAYRIINQAAKEVGIAGKIGTHTLRKTFGYHAFRKGIAISILMSIYNHHTHAETLRYIGVDKCEENLIKVDVNL